MSVMNPCRRPAALSSVLLVIVLFTLAPSAAAQTGAGAEAEVRAAESRRFAAMVRGDVGELKGLLAEDLTYVHSSGQAQTREELLADLASGALRYRSIEPTIPRVRVHGDVAVVNGRAAVRLETAGRLLEAVLVYTDIYVRRDGRWLLMAWQSTRVPPPTPPAPPVPPDPPVPQCRRSLQPRRLSPATRAEMVGTAGEGPHEWRRGEYVVSDDPSRLDLGVVHAYLARSYWAAGIPEETVARSIAGSLCFGIYHVGPPGEGQVAFARAITDRATFAYLADVFVLEEHRGRGLARWLMEVIVAHPDLQGLRRWALVTRDAHELYRPFGFREVAAPERHMERLDPGAYRARPTDPLGGA